MCKDARERHKWKVRIAGTVDKLHPLIKRPVCKLIAETLFGLLSSGSLRLSEIARALKEPTRLHHTQKRLSRMLARHSEVTWAAEQLLLGEVTSQITEDMILAIDPGDLNHDGAPKSEHRGRVRDGDAGDIVGGYPMISVVARDVRQRITLPVLTRLLSAKREGYRSENTDIVSVMDEVSRHLRVSPLWVIDRGGDRGRLWSAWFEGGYRMLVRAANQRYWLWRDQPKTAQQIAKALPLKHRGKLRASGKETVHFGVTRVQLREHPEKPLWMLVVRHGKREPLVLVTTEAVRGRRQGERMIQAYMDRWACEEGYRFSKQGFALEGVQARRFNTLQNLVALATLAWGLLAIHQITETHLLEKARRLKPRKALRFPFYSLLKGWQQLFATAQQIFYPWWRQPTEPEAAPPPVADLFSKQAGLLAGVS